MLFDGGEEMGKSGGIRNHHRLSEHSTAFGASDIEDIAELSQIRKLNVIKSTGGRQKEKARFDRYRNRKRDKKLNQTLILSKTLSIIIKTDSSRDFGFRDEGESSVEECYAFSGFAF